MYASASTATVGAYSGTEVNRIELTVLNRPLMLVLGCADASDDGHKDHVDYLRDECGRKGCDHQPAEL